MDYFQFIHSFIYLTNKIIIESFTKFYIYIPYHALPYHAPMCYNVWYMFRIRIELWFPWLNANVFANQHHMF
jgi:hypothetical protein